MGWTLAAIGRDIRRLEEHQVVFAPVPLWLGDEAARVPEPGGFQ